MQKMQHFTGKELELLKYFYQKKKGYVRQIKREVKLSEHTLLKYLNSLEKRKIITLREEGNLKIYEINAENALVKVFYSYFDLVRLDDLEYRRGKAVNMFVMMVKGVKIPYFVLLFGSTAKDNYTIKSDVDIIVIYDNIEKSVKDKVESIKKLIVAETGIMVNCIVMRLNEFLKEKENKQNYAIQDALAHGYPVFGNQLYYEMK